MPHICRVGLILGQMSLLVLLTASAGVQASPATPHRPVSGISLPTNAQLTRWISQLASQRFKIRQQAESRLITVGDAAVGRLTAGLHQTQSAEMRNEITIILTAIRRSDFWRGPLITLNVNNAPAKTVFAKICQSSGIKFRYWPSWAFTQPSAPRVTLHVSNVPFWSVLHTMDLKTGLSPGTMPGFKFQRWDSQSNPLTSSTKVDIARRFIFVIQDTQYTQTAQPTAKKLQITRNFSINFDMGVAPAGIHTAIQGNIVVQKAMDNLGHDMAYPNPPSPGDAAGQFAPDININDPWFMFSDSVPLRWPGTKATSIRTFAGYVPVQVVTGFRRIVIGHLTKFGQNIKQSGITFHYIGMKSLPGRRWQINLSFKLHGQQNSPWNIGLSQQLLQNIVVKAANGKTMPLVGESYGQDGPAYQFTDTFAGPKPAQIQFPVYTQHRETRAYFVFHNIPIP